MSFDLTGQKIKLTYQQVVQHDSGSGKLYNGLGTEIAVSASATSASHAIRADIADSLDSNYISLSASYAATSSTVNGLFITHSGSPSFEAETGSLYVDNEGYKLFTKTDSGSYWQGIGHNDIAYLYISGTNGTQPGELGCELVAPATWSVSRYNTIYFCDDSQGDMQVIIPDSDAYNQGKQMTFVKPRLVESANKTTLVTPSNQAITKTTRFDLEGSGDSVSLNAVPFVANGNFGYKWRQDAYRLQTRLELSVGDHGTLFSTVSGAVEFFNNNAIGDTLIKVNGGSYTEDPIKVSNTNYNLKIEGVGSSLTHIYPSSNTYSSSLFVLDTPTDITKMTIDATTLSGYGLHTDDRIIRVSSSNGGNYYELKDLFIYGGYTGVCCSSDDNQVYMLDAEFAYATQSAVCMTSNTTMELVDIFFSKNNIGVGLSTGSMDVNINSCHFDVDPGDIGIFYNSGSVTITNFDIISSVFSGSGTYFSGNTTFETIDEAKIEIRGNGGLANNTPFGYFTYEDNTDSMVLGGAATYYKASGSNTISTPVRKMIVSDNRVQYVGLVQSPRTKEFQIVITGTLKSDSNNDVISVAAVKNGDTATVYGKVNVKCATAGEPYNYACQAIVELSQDDYVEVFIASEDAGRTVTLEDIQFTVREL